MGWASTRNGALIQLAADAGFDALITADKNMEYQQNADNLLLSVIVLATIRNRLGDLKPLVPSVLEILGTMQKPGFYRIDT